MRYTIRGGERVDNRRMTVKCSVDSCEYWDKGNFCGADGIQVDNNMGSAGTSMEIGSIGSVGADANTSAGTCCQTFKPKSQ